MPREDQMETSVTGENSPLNLHLEDPNYWEEHFAGSPLSLMVPPYIRFLESILLWHHAGRCLSTAIECARSGQPQLAEALEGFEESAEAKLQGVSFEKYFASQLLIVLVSKVEHFLGSAVSAALRLHPKKMGSRTFRLSELIEASSKQEIIDHAARSVLNDLMYEKPLNYLNKLCEILSIETETLLPLWPDFVEVKARRDLGIHNNWVVNGIYQRKLSEVELASNLSIGDSILPDFAYLAASGDKCQRLVKEVANLLGEKWIKVTEEQNA